MDSPLQALRRQQRDDLAKREKKIAASMRSRAMLRKKDWPNEKLLEHTRRGLDRAVLHGLAQGDDLLKFLQFRHLFGERFDEVPVIRQFIEREDLPEMDRMDAMILTIPPSAWEVVVENVPEGPSPVGIEPEPKMPVSQELPQINNVTLGDMAEFFGMSRRPTSDEEMLENFAKQAQERVDRLHENLANHPSFTSDMLKALGAVQLLQACEKNRVLSETFQHEMQRLNFNL